MKEKWVPRPVNAVRRKRWLAWREDFRKKQTIALEKARTMLKSKSLSQIEWDEVYDVIHNKRGPRFDQIKRIDKIWNKLKDRV